MKEMSDFLKKKGTILEGNFTWIVREKENVTFDKNLKIFKLVEFKNA
jgi:hypothetical protein